MTINCSTAGATIHYTLDGTNPTPNSAVYTAPIAISETTTIKAFATMENMTDSGIATATYTIQAAPTPTLITIAEARALANDEYALVQGVVTFIDPQSNGTVNVYVQVLHSVSAWTGAEE